MYQISKQGRGSQLKGLAKELKDFSPWELMHVFSVWSRITLPGMGKLFHMFPVGKALYKTPIRQSTSDRASEQSIRQASDKASVQMFSFSLILWLF
jgi:hypothetical protein